MLSTNDKWFTNIKVTCLVESVWFNLELQVWVCELKFVPELLTHISCDRQSKQQLNPDDLIPRLICLCPQTKASHNRLVCSFSLKHHTEWSDNIPLYLRRHLMAGEGIMGKSTRTWLTLKPLTESLLSIRHAQHNRRSVDVPAPILH